MGPGFMQWLVGLASITGLIWVMLQIGRHFDNEDDPRFRAIRERFGLWLTSQNAKGLSERVSKANEFFFHWFDALFHGKGTLLEQGLWLGLIFSPVILVLTRLILLVTGQQMPQSGWMLFLAIVQASILSTTVVGSRALERKTKKTGNSLLFIFSVFLGGAVVGGVLGPLFSVYSDETSQILYYMFLGVCTGLLGSIVVGGMRGVFSSLWGVVVLGGVSIVPGGFFYALTSVLSAAGGGALSLIASQLLNFRLPVHPLRSVASSLIAVLILGTMMRGATSSFYHLLLQAGPIVLSYVAFNIFADGISLLETRWVLRRSLNLGLLALLGLVLLDLVLSAAIFLFLPFVLGELSSFWESIFFGGSRPWLGIFFWSTFSTSALFYFFVGTVVFLIVPGQGLGRLFHRTVGRFYTIESRPFTAIAWGMIILIAATAALVSAGTFLYHLVAS